MGQKWIKYRTPNDKFGSVRSEVKKREKKEKRRCRGSNPGHPRDRREYSPLYYNDLLVSYSNRRTFYYFIQFEEFPYFTSLDQRTGLKNWKNRCFER